MSNQNNYRYDAFISYRHCDPDKFIAETLHKSMETFKLPGSLKRKTTRDKIHRVFRDEEELPLASNLEDPIIDALEHSEYLIVICTPRLRESIWCRKEIETFISMHGRDKVLLVLGEGEPSESFPEEMLYEERQVTLADGSVQTVRTEKEPLAADFRGEDHKTIKNKMKLEMLRLLAPMFGVGFDDLRQRHRERRVKRIIAISLAVAIMAIAFGIYSTVTALRINSQKNHISAQAKEIQKQANTLQQQADALKRQAEEIQSQNDSLRLNVAQSLATEAETLFSQDDRIGSIETAIRALTRYQDADMPYTAHAQYILTEATHFYEGGNQYNAITRLYADGNIQQMVLTPDTRYIAYYDNVGKLYLWDLQEYKRLKVWENEYSSIYSTSDRFGFLDNNTFFYVDDNQVLSFIDLETLEPTGIAYEDASHCVVNKNHTLYCVSQGSSITVRDVATHEIRYEATAVDWEHSIRSDYLFEETDRYFFYGTTIDYFSESLDVHIVDLTTGEELVIPNVDGYTLCDAVVSDGIAYFMLNGTESITMFANVQAVDLQTQRILWTRSLLGTHGKFLHLNYNGLTVMTTDHSLEILDTKDSNVLFSTNLEAELLFYVYSEGYYSLFLSNGSAAVLTLDSYTTMTSRLWNARVKNLDAAALCYFGIAGLTTSHNYIIMYGRTANADAEVYTGEYATYEVEEQSMTSNSDLRELLKSLDPVTYMRAMNAYKTPDENYLVVFYSHAMLRLYSLTTNKLLYEMECHDTPHFYFGEDAYGNFYFGGYTYGYGVNKQGEIFVRINSMKGLTPDGMHIVAESYWEDGLVTYPIYTVEELIRRAGDIVTAYK